MKLIVMLVGLVLAGPAVAQAPSAGDREQVLATVDAWYGELAKLGEGYAYRLTAPGFIDASPHYDHVDTGAANLGPRIYTSLAATALRFSYEVTDLRMDPNFAKARVWEKGYFYASAGAETYELAASALFILEREPGSGRWLILAHQSDSIGIPSTMKTVPMPDLRAEWERRQSAGGRLLEQLSPGIR